MKISSLLETFSTPSTSTDNEGGCQAPEFGRDPHVLETMTSGSVAPVAGNVGATQRRVKGKGSVFQGIKTSKKFANSVSVKESKDMCSVCGQTPCNCTHLTESHDNPVANAIFRRLQVQKPDLFSRYGLEYVADAVYDVVDSVGNIGPDDEIGTSDVSGWVKQVEWNLKNKLNQYDEPIRDIENLDEQGVAEDVNTGPQIIYATGPRTMGVNDVDLVFKNLRTGKIVAHVVGNNYHPGDDRLQEFAPPDRGDGGSDGGDDNQDKTAKYEIRMSNSKLPTYIAFGDPQEDERHKVYKLVSGKTDGPTYYGMGMTLVSKLDWWNFLEKMLGEIMWEDDAIEAGYVDRKDDGDLVFLNKQQGVAEGDYDIRRDPTYQKYNPETHTMMYKDGKHKAVKHDQVAKAKSLGWKVRSSLKAFAKGQSVAEGLADELMKIAQAKGMNARVRGTPEQERERTQQMLAQRQQERQEQEKLAAQEDYKQLPELKAKYEEMVKLYKSLGGSNWQYADREQNLTDRERQARSMEPELNRLGSRISRAEKLGGKQLNELFDAQQEYFKLADGQIIRVDYRQAGLNADGIPNSIKITPVNPKIMPMSGMQSIQPWDKARQNIRTAIQQWVEKSQGTTGIQEKITKKMSAGDVISDFVHSDDPKFSGDSKKKRIKRALGAYYKMHPEKSKRTDEAQAKEDALFDKLSKQLKDLLDKPKDKEIANKPSPKDIGKRHEYKNIIASDINEGIDADAHTAMELAKEMNKDIDDLGNILASGSKTGSGNPHNINSLRQSIISLDKEIKELGYHYDPKSPGMIRKAGDKSFTENKEQDYGPEYQDMVKRVGQLAKEGPRKVVYDPVKRVYKTVPVNQQKSDDDVVKENLRQWFKEKWVRFGPDGKIRGACARGDDSEGKPKCLPQAKAHALGKKGRKYAAAKKRREDPNPERRGPAKNVATKKKSNEGVTEAVDTNNLTNITHALGKLKGREAFVRIGDPRLPLGSDTQFKRGIIYDREVVHGLELSRPFKYWLKDESGRDFSAPERDVFVSKQGVAEGSQDKTVKIVKRHGKPIGEIGIDPEASPGNGAYYVKLYDGSVDLSGFDTQEEALAELKYLVKQSVAEGLNEIDFPIEINAEIINWIKEKYPKATVGQLSDKQWLFDKVREYHKQPKVLSGVRRAATDAGRIESQEMAEDQLDELKCWPGYTRVQGVPAGAPGSCKKKTSEDITEEKCPHCGGPMFSEMVMNEKKDACYYKVKSRYKVWPSAYASGALVKCRKKGADNWGNKSK